MVGFLIDLDGTLYKGSEPIPAAADFIAYLRQHNLPFLLLTNNSSRTPEEVAAHIYSICGISVQPSEVFTSSQATARYIADQQQNGLVYCIGEAGLEQALIAEGLTILQHPNDEMQRSTLRSTIDRYGSPRYVVQGIDRQFNYTKLKLAMNFIAEGATSINTNPDRALPTNDGLQPGAGSIAAALEAASGVKPVVIGKPSAIIMDYAVELLGLPANDIWVVGDNLNTDIRGGITAGCKTLLVLTGLATSENCQQQVNDSGIQPDLICADLIEFIVHLQRNTDLL